MCFDFDALPPDLPPGRALPRVAGGAAAESLTLESADGTRFAAALAESPRSGEVGVVVLPDVRGLYRFYVELAERFAEAGHDAIAIDYFGRSAGVGTREEDFDCWPHVAQVETAKLQADVGAAIALLRERTDVSSIVTVGFCFGGSHSFIAATSPELGLDGAVGFYGMLLAERGGLDYLPSPLRGAEATRAPVLGLFGGADQVIPPEDVAAFETALTAAGVEHELVTYEGAPHSFFDRSAAAHARASADAWERVLDFLARAPVASAA